MANEILKQNLLTLLNEQDVQARIREVIFNSIFRKKHFELTRSTNFWIDCAKR